MPKDREPRLAVERARDVAFAIGIFSNQEVTGRHSALAAVAVLDSEATDQHQHDLLLRCLMPVVVESRCGKDELKRLKFNLFRFIPSAPP